MEQEDGLRDLIAFCLWYRVVFAFLWSPDVFFLFLAGSSVKCTPPMAMKTGSCRCFAPVNVQKKKIR
jgi:hypothetical protein